MDTHLPGPGGRGKELELPTGQETLTALRDGEGGEREWGEWEGVGRRDENGNFYNLINFGKIKNRGCHTMLTGTAVSPASPFDY